MDRRRVIFWDPERLHESEWLVPARLLKLELVGCFDEATLGKSIEDPRSVGLVVHLESLTETICHAARAARERNSPLQLIFVTRSPRSIREALKRMRFSAEVLWHPACPLDVLRRFAHS